MQLDVVFLKILNWGPKECLEFSVIDSTFPIMVLFTPLAWVIFQRKYSILTFIFVGNIKYKLMCDRNWNNEVNIVENLCQD